MNRTVLEKAFEAGDKETVIDAYLDMLDYDLELGDADVSLFEKVLESMSFDEAVDHVLFGHVKEQMEKRGFTSKLYNCIYYLHANGGLTAADLLKEMASDANTKQLANSELFKAEFIDKVFPGEEAEDQNPLKLDNYVLEQVQLALKQLKGKIDLEFYESAASYLAEKKVEAEPKPVEEPAAEETADAEEPVKEQAEKQT